MDHDQHRSIFGLRAENARLRAELAESEERFEKLMTAVEDYQAKKAAILRGEGVPTKAARKLKSV